MERAVSVMKTSVPAAAHWSHPVNNLPSSPAAAQLSAKPAWGQPPTKQRKTIAFILSIQILQSSIVSQSSFFVTKIRQKWDLNYDWTVHTFPSTKGKWKKGLKNVKPSNVKFDGGSNLLNSLPKKQVCALGLWRLHDTVDHVWTACFQFYKKTNTWT